MTTTPKPPKSDAIIVTAIFVVRYDKKIFGEASAAENTVANLQTVMELAVTDQPRADMRKWLPKPGKVEG